MKSFAFTNSVASLQFF